MISIEQSTDPKLLGRRPTEDDMGRVDKRDRGQTVWNTGFFPYARMTPVPEPPRMPVRGGWLCDESTSCLR